MSAVRVVLFRRDEDEDKELELGPFNQGVHFTPAGNLCVDTATNATVAQMDEGAWYATPEGLSYIFPDLHLEPYERLHVHAVEQVWREA